ncbi:MAG: DUF131 domain-containing protein [Candidatus Woesearchaeota archaeon]|nr:MAG: DUF131 domain-containing protein [Candidatus Woesearchaeota archaeon]
MGLNEIAGVGIIFVLIGVILIFIAAFTGGEKSNVKAAGVLFLGPFPVIGGVSDKRYLWVLVVLVVIGILLWIFNRRII